MACIDFDPEDYLDEVDTEKLLDELRRRRLKSVDVARDLREAWRTRDVWLFDRAVEQLERKPAALLEVEAQQRLYFEHIRQMHS